MTSVQLQVSKLDAARRQLETAIRLYFHEADPVSIHTLTAAGYELLRHLKKKAGGELMLKDWLLEGVKPEFRREVADSLNEAQNFFKHSDRDSSATLDFNPEQTEWLLLDACDAYRKLASELVPALRVYQLWSWTHWARRFIQDQEWDRSMASVDPKTWDKPKAEFYGFWLPIGSAAGAVSQE